MQPLKSNLKLTLQMLFILTVLSNQLMAQGITTGSGTTLTGGSATITLPGNWSNSGTFTPGTSTVIFNGSSGNQTITNSGGESFNNLTVDKSAGDLQFLSDVSVSGTVTLTSGDTDLNGNSLSLGTSGTLSETAGNTVKGTSGIISASNSGLNAPSSYNMGGLGAVISSSANLGSTTITRGHAVQTGNSNNSILRYFDISPAINTGLNATLVFYYDDSESNSLTESELELFKSTDTGSSWTQMGGTVNTTNNTVTLAGLDGFSRWTLGASSLPLPVELTSFTAEVNEKEVLLKWQTETEVNNYGFEVERAPSPTTPGQDEWEKLGFVDGHGNSNSPKEYSFIDKEVIPGKYSYRLKQIDNDGSFEYSDIIEVEVEVVLPTKFELFQNYPNPFNPSTYISFALPKQSQVKLVVYNLLGQEVAEIINATMEAGVHNVVFDASSLASGTYIYRIVTTEYTEVKKMILMR